MAETQDDVGVLAIEKYQVLVVAGGEAKGFDFSILVNILFPVLVESLTNCLGKKADEATISRRLLKGSGDTALKLRTLTVLRDEFRRSGDKVSSRELNTLAETVLDSFREVGSAGVSAMLKEYQAVNEWQLI